jgi:hypothetical protein
MMSTMDAAPPPSDMRRSVAIDFLFLDATQCSRCSGTGTNIETALSAVEGVLRATGARVELRKIHVQSDEQARKLQFVSSPTIRVNGRDIATEAVESECGADGCGCGAGASCRLWRYAGREHTEAPVGLIVDAVLSEIYAGTKPAESPPSEDLMALQVAHGGGCCS